MSKSIAKKTGKAKAADRRSFIKGAALAGAGATVAAASSFPAPAVAQKRIEMTMVTTWPRWLAMPSAVWSGGWLLLRRW